MVHGNGGKNELADQRMKKGGRLEPRFYKGERQPRVHDAKGNAGDARTRPYVQDANRHARQDRSEEQRVKKESPADVRTRPERREVVRAVPENQQIGVAAEGIALGRRSGSAQQGREGLEELLERVGPGSRHAGQRGCRAPGVRITPSSSYARPVWRACRCAPCRAAARSGARSRASSRAPGPRAS